MAFDRFVAIRDPLHYASILTHGIIGKIGIAVIIRAVCMVFPVPFLIKRLPFCHSNVLSHSYCLHQDAMRLACASTCVNGLYGLIVVIFTLGFDALNILFSYVPILKTVLDIASRAERLKALNTCLSHICAVLIFLCSSHWCHHDPQVWETSVTSSTHIHGQYLSVTASFTKPCCL